MIRQELIDKGKVWQVYLDIEPENILFEGTKTRCNKYIREKYSMRLWKQGIVRLAKIIWEET